MSEEKNRVVFYSKEDLSFGHHLKSAESIIENFDSKKPFDINDLIELYQIKLYFDNDIYLNKWTIKVKTTYKEIVETFSVPIQLFWSKIDNENILELYGKINYEFYGSFWSLTNKFKTFKQIESQTIISILESAHFSIGQILEQKNIVNHFSKEIREYLISKENSAEILLSNFEEKHLSIQPVLHFPSNLTQLDKELIILKYLDSSNANLNYVRLVVKSRNIRLSDKTKLKAKKLSDKLNNEILEKGATWTQGIQVAISKDQIESIKRDYSQTEKRLSYTYSEYWLNSTKDSLGIFQNFSNLFGYINNQGCIHLVSKSCEIDSFERVFIRSKNEYFNSIKFHEKSLLSHAQLLMYLHYLKENEIFLEDVLSYIINEYLNDNYNINCIEISFPSKNTSAIEKIRMLAPELEFIIKQYNSYAEEGFIDFELLRFSSSPLHLSRVKSKVKRKYAYGTGKEFLRLKYDFFSSQSMLNYIEPYKEKYQNLYQLLKNENVKYDEFKGYQQPEIDYLISKDYLLIDFEGNIKIQNQDSVFVIGVLHYEDVISFWHYPENIKNKIVEFEKKDIVKFEDNLFTIEERKYLNYYLNKKEFTNGLDLRNKYLHGTNSSSIDEQENDYNILLKLLILVIFKIYDDLNIEKNK